MSEYDAHLAALLGIDPGSPEPEVLRLLVRLAVQAVDAREGSYFVYDPHEKDLVIAMTTAEAKTARRLVGRRLPLGTGVTGLAAATREVQIGAPRYHFEEEGEEPPPPEGEALIAAPVIWRDDLLGVLTAVSFDPERRFTANDASLYASVATFAALLLHQRRRISELEQALHPGLEGATDETSSSDAGRIAASVRRLAQWSSLTTVARVLETIEDLVGRRGDA